MAGITNGDIFRAAFYVQRGEKTAAMVRSFQCVSGGGTVTYATVAGNLKSVIQPGLDNLYDDRVALLGVSCTRVWPTPATPELSTFAPVPFTGTNTSHFYPDMVAGLAQLRADTAPSRSRGRIYFPFPRESDSGPDGKPSVAYLNAAYAAAFELARPRIIHFGPTVAVIPVIWRKGSPTSWRITAHAAQPHWATQRRRTRNQNVRTL